MYAAPGHLVGVLADGSRDPPAACPWMTPRIPAPTRGGCGSARGAPGGRHTRTPHYHQGHGAFAAPILGQSPRVFPSPHGEPRLATPKVQPPVHTSPGHCIAQPCPPSFPHQRPVLAKECCASYGLTKPASCAKPDQPTRERIIPLTSAPYRRRSAVWSMMSGKARHVAQSARMSGSRRTRFIQIICFFFLFFFLSFLTSAPYRRRSAVWSMISGKARHVAQSARMSGSRSCGSTY
jgi:hypothetical protein